MIVKIDVVVKINIVVKIDIVVKVKAKGEILPHLIIKMLYAIIAKKKHIANYYIEPTLMLKDNNKNGKILKTIQLRVVTFFQIRDLKNLDLLDFEAINYVHNF